MDYIAMIIGGVLGAFLGTCITDFDPAHRPGSTSRNLALVRWCSVIVSIWIIAECSLWAYSSPLTKSAWLDSLSP